MANIRGREMEPIPDYGDLMTAEDFIDTCMSGGFIDYDGHGYYATDREMSRIKVTPSMVKADGFVVGWTHVVWFNR